MNEMASASITFSCDFIQAPELILSQAALDLAETFDPLDAVAMKDFGIAVMNEMVELAPQLSVHHQIVELGETVNLLQAMVDVVESPVLEQLFQPSFLSKLPFIGERYDPVKMFCCYLDSNKAQFERLTLGLKVQMVKLGQQLSQFDLLTQNCANVLQQLEMHIEAGQFRLAQLNHTVLPQLQEQAQKSGHIVDAQQYQEATQAVMKLDERVDQLMMTRFAALNLAPQIRFTQQGNQILLAGIEDIMCDTLPSWQQELVDAVEQKEQAPELAVVQKRVNAMHQTLSNMLTHAKTNKAKSEQAQLNIRHLFDELNQTLSQTLAECESL